MMTSCQVQLKRGTPCHYIFSIVTTLELGDGLQIQMTGRRIKYVHVCFLPFYPFINDIEWLVSCLLLACSKS